MVIAGVVVGFVVYTVVVFFAGYRKGESDARTMEFMDRSSHEGC